MGIKNLWNMLQPYSERKPLFELQNKTVAVDLAGWVCEAMCVVNYEVQPRFYLRNLFFRTSYLLLSGVTPVFVLEGSAPALKYGVICKRIEAGPFAGQRPRPIVRHAGVDGQTNNPKKAAKGRSSFNHILKHCEKLLTSMGVTCVQGPGEAEAFCAYLNRIGLVDGVISQDSDCFAYGARRVYRNFSVASQGKTAAQGGMVEVYDMDKIEKSMDFGQQKMVAMALLCGCDYCPDGVAGIGRDAVFKFFGLYEDHEVLDRMREWRNKPDSKFEGRCHDRVLCTTCGHHGSEHYTNGCKTCGTSVKCSNSELEPEQMMINQKQIKSEQLIRRKALVDPQFPSEAIIDEFLVMPSALPASIDLRWKQPNVVKFVRLMHESVQWNDAYAMSKILPMLTRWQLFHLGAAVDDESDGTDTAADRLAARASKVASMHGSVQPDCIRKKRTPKGVASYEIVWKDSAGCFEGLFTDIQTDNYLREHDLLGDSYTPWSTIEPVDLVERAYPELIEKFHALIQAKKKPVSRRIAAVAQLGVAQASLPARKRRAPRPAKLNSKQVSTNPGPSDAAATSSVATSGSASDPLRANSKSTTKTPVMIDRFLQRMQARYVRKSTRKAELAAAAEAKTPVRPTIALRPRTFLSPVIRTSDLPMNLSQFSFGGNDSAAWMEDAENVDSGNVSAVIREMVNENSTSMSFCGRRLRFETVLDTSEVYFMTIAQPEEDENDGVQLEVKAVAGSSSAKTKAVSGKVSAGKSKAGTTSPKKPIDTPGSEHTSPKTPKALRGRPVAKLRYLHSYTDNNDVLIRIPIDPDVADDPTAKSVGPWESEKLTFCNPFERLADDDEVNQRNVVNGNSEPAPNEDGNDDEPMPIEADVPVPDDSMDEFDRLVIGGQTARCPVFTSAFVHLPPPAVTYIGKWSRIDVIDASGRVQSSEDASATDSAAPLLQINGNAGDLICRICSRIDPYSLHQCRVPVSADANVALVPPTNTPAGEHATLNLYGSGATPRTELYMWGNVQISHRSMCLNPGHQFQQYIDYWRHHHDFDDLTGVNINSLRHPPDMAMHEFNCELDAIRKADGGSHFGTSTPQTQDRSSRSRLKRRSSGALSTTVLPAFDARNSDPLSVSHFFQVADHLDLEWSFDDAVDNGATGKKDTFETCISLWHEPDAFRPADGELVETMLNTPPPRHVDAAAAEAARQYSEERQQSVMRWRAKHGEHRRDFCDNEVRMMCRGKVSFKAKLVTERPHHNWNRVKGPHKIDDVLMVGPMTPSVLAGDRPDVSFTALSPDEPSSAQPHVLQRSAKRNGVEATTNGVVPADSVASGSGTQLSNGTAATSLATIIAATTVNDSFTLNDSYVPVSKKLRNKLDSVE